MDEPIKTLTPAAPGRRSSSAPATSPSGAVSALMSISGCANTIQGFGADSANAVSATQKATQAVGAAAINAVQ